MIIRLSFLLIMVFALFSCNSEPASSDTKTSNEEVVEAAKVQSIGSHQAKNLLQEQGDIVILDVRTPREYHAGHLKNAQLIDFHGPEFSKQLQALDTDKTYVVYCASGGRSSKAAQMMGNIGFKQVYEASEGFSALKDAGLPVEKESHE